MLLAFIIYSSFKKKVTNKNPKDKNGDTPLHWGAAMGHLGMSINDVKSFLVEFCNLTLHNVMRRNVGQCWLHSGPNQLKKCFRLLTLALNFGH